MPGGFRVLLFDDTILFVVVSVGRRNRKLLCGKCSLTGDAVRRLEGRDDVGLAVARRRFFDDGLREGRRRGAREPRFAGDLDDLFHALGVGEGVFNVRR